jgi:putative N6-adenine-specific DNA methylase
MKFCVTFPQGLETVGKFELSDLGFTGLSVEDRLIRFEWKESDVAKLNVHLRSAQRVFIELASGRVHSFDELFELVRSVDWKKFTPKDSPILVRTHIGRHHLSHEPSVQKIVKKAIISKLTGGLHWNENEAEIYTDILVVMQNEMVYILWDTSGDPLHKRWYRKEAGEAPIKENLAAGLLSLIRYNPKFPFYDPCAWSGTFGIEAWMIATNTPPGLRRSFRFEKQPWAHSQWITDVKAEALQNIRPLASALYLCDNDPSMALMIQRLMNECHIPREDIIIRTETFDPLHPAITTGFMCSNPPYGMRLTEGDVAKLHGDIEHFLVAHEGMRWGIITGYEPWITKLQKNMWKERKLFNGSIEVRFAVKQGK